MNWTGGRLQRHSKANSNAVVKAQKDYFARARLRHSNKPTVPTPLYISIAAADNHEKHTHRSRGQRRRQVAPDDEPPYSNSKRGALPNPTLHNAARSRQGGHLESRRLNVQGSPLTTSPRVNTLEHVKRSLLKQSDWLSIAPARPPKINSRPSADSGQIGRRRRVTREDRARQKHCADQRKVEHDLIKPFAQKTRAFQPAESENVSIRIGSNIHQSQAIESGHQSEKRATAVSQSSSTEPMLLDILEAQVTVRPMKDLGPYYFEQQGNNNYLPDQQVDGEAITDDNSLIPLEKARDFANFDEVKAYSSLTKQTTSSSASISMTEPQTYGVPQAQSVRHTSSSLAKVRPVSGRGVFTSDLVEHGSRHKAAAVSSEPPQFSEYQEDLVMRDMEIGLSMHEPLQASDGAYVAASEPLIARAGLKKANQASRSRVDVPRGFARTPDNRNGIPRENTSAQQPRPAYTIDRQVQLEKNLTLQNDHPMRTENNMPGEVSEYPNQGSYRTGDRDTSGRRSTPANYDLMAEMESSYQDSPRQRLIAGQIPAATGKPRRQGDENEEWMRDVFSTDFNKLQQRFSLAKAPTRNSVEQAFPRIAVSREGRSEGTESFNHSSDHELSLHSSSDPSLPKTIRTAANTTLNMRQDSKLTHQSSLPSETDFLTQMSPMTGYLDDRVVNVSTYNNAARTVRSFVDAPYVSQKRSASDAFGDDSYDRCDEISLFDNRVQKPSSPAMYRIPLDTMHQLPLRANYYQFILSPVLRRDEEDMPRSIWRHAKPPSPLKINRAGQNLRSEGHSQATPTPHRRRTVFPLDYTPIGTSIDQLSIKTRLEGRRQALHTASSNYDSQFSSPTTLSQHRVPLLSKNEVRCQGNGHHAQQQSIARQVETGNIFRTSARLENPPSSWYVNTPSSSSSSVSNHNGARPVANIHTNDRRPFVFKRPQRPAGPAAQFSHPSRATPGFRFPRPVPLH
jgi:hypothetical protein